MSILRMRTRLDLSKLDRLERRVGQNADGITRDWADMVVNDINSNWADSSPSAQGGPPAKISGELERSVRVTRQTEGGQFASRLNAVRYTIRYTAPYANVLENRFYSPPLGFNRPFLLPALQRAQDNARGMFERIFR